MSIDELAERTRVLKLRARNMQSRYQMGAVTYEEMAEAAKEFCKAFDDYHKAKFGKSKKLDYRAFLR